MDIRDLIKKYLQEAKLMQLATSVDNKPWVCSVWYAADEDLNIYWFSSTTRRHSEEILKNNHVAVTMVLAQTPADAPRGLQLEGIAEILPQEDVDKAVSVYQNRIFPQEKIQSLMANKDKPHKFYRIRPTRFVLFDAVNFPNNPRQELTL